MELFNTSKTFLNVKYADKLKHIETDVTYSFELESEAPDFEYGSKEENDKEMARFDSGELLNVTLIVKASALGETGADYLGQCFVRAKHLEADLIQLTIEHDMKNNACIELHANILYQYEVLKNALVG